MKPSLPPLGSCIYPLCGIFLIFINELPAVVKRDHDEDDAEVVIFADDNTPMVKHEDPNELHEKLEGVAKKVSEWFKSNQMIVSGEKTKLIITSTNANRRNKIGDDLVKVKIDGHDQTEAACEKLLGIFVNKEGNWKTHLCGDGAKQKGLLQDLSKRVGMLKQLRNKWDNCPT